MNVRHISDQKTSIGELLKDAGDEGLLVESPGADRYALLPLDDDLVDYLLERNPDFIDACRRIGARMRAGHSHSHEQVKQMLGEPPEGRK